MPKSRASFPPRVLSVLLSALALVACGQDTGGNALTASGETLVTSQTVALSPWSDTISALGTVRASESVTVTAKVSEVVQEVHFDSGDHVRAGATLVTLSGNQQRAALQAAEATAAEAQAAYQRHLELVDQQLISRSTLDTQRALHESAQARVAQMRADIGDRIIQAPFTGVLGIRQISQGALITPGAVIATLDDISRVYVDFPVPEGQLALLAVGQPVKGNSVAWPGEVFNGVVSVVDTRLDQVTRSVVVRADFPNDDYRLRPGMLLQVVVERPVRQALVVPELALVQVGRDTFLWRVGGDDTVERVAVAVGQRRAGSAEIVSGIEAGDRIVVDGIGKLRPGLKVTDAPAGTSPDAAPDAE